MTQDHSPQFTPYPAYKPSGVEWLGDVPAHWEVRRLKRICRFAYGNSLAYEQRTSGDIPVYGSNGQIDYHSSPNTIGECLIIGRKGSFGKVHYSPKPAFAIDTTFFVDKRYTDANIRWLFYLLKTLRLDSVSMDSAVPGLNREDAYSHICAYPPIAEQRAIAAYLDRIGDLAHRYAEVSTRIIALLRELRQSEIRQAVTRVLDEDAPLRPSGVEWIGDIPAHWQMRRLKYSAKLIMGQSPDGWDCAETPIGLPFLQGCAEFGDVHPTPVLYCRAPRKISPIGAILLSVRAPVGRLNFADQEYVIGRGLCAIIPDGESLDPTFAYYHLLSLDTGLRMASTGSTYDAVSVHDIGVQPIIAPPLAEQRAIAAHLDARTAAIDAGIAYYERTAALVSEYWASLTLHAVTGQMDVRGMA